MPHLLHQFIDRQAEIRPHQTALAWNGGSITYEDLAALSRQVANGLLEAGIGRGERVAIYLPKQVETVASILGAASAGATFVPINPALKPRQVGYILRHCHTRVLITSLQRLRGLSAELDQCDSLDTVVVTDTNTADEPASAPNAARWRLLPWPEFCSAEALTGHRVIDTDMTAILYTSGSTGLPKGVVLSHRNLVTGAKSVASYLENTPEDRILALLPLSFDAGLSQLTTAFHRGATGILLDYLMPGDVIRAVVNHRASGLAAVPPLWHQLLQLEWPEEVARSLRYVTNTGGAMPVSATRQLRRRLPQTRIFLMYGLTEAFRSTYLPPEEVDRRPRSIGKAIPNAEIMVVNEQGDICGPNEPGELVHRGSLVALGYWNDPEKTAARFRAAPGREAGLPIPELAVWSGDQVVKDEEGFLYFVTRKDEMIKTSGYRVSPTEIEEVVFDSGLVTAAVALGRADEQLGQAIVLVVVAADPEAGEAELSGELMRHCRRELPSFMVPHRIHLRDALPCNANGKFDRQRLRNEYAGDSDGDLVSTPLRA